MTPTTQHAIDREIHAAAQERLKKIGDRIGAKRAYERQRAAVMAMLAQEAGRD